MSSPEDRSPISRNNVSRSGSIIGEKSRSRSNLKKDISIDEGDALKKISEMVGSCKDTVGIVSMVHI